MADEALEQLTLDVKRAVSDAIRKDVPAHKVKAVLEAAQEDVHIKAHDEHIDAGAFVGGGDGDA